MNYIVKILLGCSFLFPAIFAKDNILNQPTCISLAKLEQLPRFWSAEWVIEVGNSVKFLYLNGNAAVALYKDGSELYSSALWQTLQKDTNALLPSKETDYYIDTARFFIDQKSPQLLSIQEAAQRICARKVMFYTGAGISLASGVDDMNRLMKGLGIDSESFNTQYLNYLKEHEQETLSYFAHFCNRAFTANPTKAHYAITSLAQHMNAQIITENFDFLQQRCGVMPYCITADSLRNNVSSQDLQAVDVVVCIGLSHDDRGFLGWYKRHNPQGIIIAFDMGMPRYLGAEDFLVQGDAQETLETLCRYVCDNP